MSNCVPTPDLSSGDRPSKLHSAWRYVPWLVAGLAMAPFWAVHARNLWRQPQFQIFPLLYVVLGILLYREVQFIGVPTKWRAFLGKSLIFLSAAVFLVAVLLYSPHFGQTAGVLWFLGGLITYANNLPVRRIVSFGALLSLTLIPYSVSLQISQLLQNATAYGSCGVLETIGVPHIREGNLIEVPGRLLFVDEACSGIQSLFAALSVVAMLIVTQRFAFFVTAFSLSSVPVWAVIGNLVRIVTIAFTQTKWRLDLSHGWAHMAIGYANFLIIAFFLFVWIKLLKTLFGVIPKPVSGEIQSPVIELFNRLVRWPASQPAAIVDTRGTIVSQCTPITTNVDETQHSRGSIVQKFIFASNLLAASALLLIGIANLAFMIAVGERFFDATRFEDFQPFVANSLPGKEAFAAVQGAWPIHGSEVIEREMGNTFGNYSHVWRMTSPTRFTCNTSLDFPFFEYHDLSACYRAAGWNVRRQTVQQLKDQHRPAIQSNTLPGTIESEMQKGSDRTYGFLLFAVIDEDGMLVDPPERTEFMSQLQIHLSGGPIPYIMSKLPAKRRNDLVMLQFQMLCQKSSPFTEEEKQAVRRQFGLLFPVVQSQSKAAFATMRS
jgi:exosortase